MGATSASRASSKRAYLDPERLVNTDRPRHTFGPRLLRDDWPLLGESEAGSARSKASELPPRPDPGRSVNQRTYRLHCATALLCSAITLFENERSLCSRTRPGLVVDGIPTAFTEFAQIPAGTLGSWMANAGAGTAKAAPTIAARISFLI